jgi:hypothetical protein
MMRSNSSLEMLLLLMTVRVVLLDAESKGGTHFWLPVSWLCSILQLLRAVIALCHDCSICCALGCNAGKLLCCSRCGTLRSLGSSQQTCRRVREEASLLRRWALARPLRSLPLCSPILRRHRSSVVKPSRLPSDLSSTHVQHLSSARCETTLVRPRSPFQMVAIACFAGVFAVSQPLDGQDVTFHFSSRLVRLLLHLIVWEPWETWTRNCVLFRCAALSASQLTVLRIAHAGVAGGAVGD